MKAETAAYTEHIFVTVRVHDAMGMMMAEDYLCLAENQQGYVVLTGDGMAESIAERGLVLSMDGDMIDAYGYVTVQAEDRKFTGCGASAPNALASVDTRAATSPPGTAIGPAADKITIDAASMIAAWSILQDVGSGFFGTEIPTSTITTMGIREMFVDGDHLDTEGAGMDESVMLNCYGATGAGELANVFNGRAGPAGGPYLCGLIPERHKNTLKY